MNRYYWIAIVLFGIFVILVGTIWNLDLTDQEIQKKVEFSLQTFAAIDVIATIIFSVLGALNRSKGDESKVAVSISSPKTVSDLLDKNESILQYLSNLEATLDAVGKFIPLTTEYEQDSEDNVIHILQSFEWAKREVQSQIINISRQPIDLLEAHKKFQRYVLLGDPGSGKTTCLQYLTLDLISQYKAGTSRVLPFYIRLSAWKDRRTSALEFLKSSFGTLSGSDSYVFQEFDALLARGDLLIILDGLNEIPNRQYYHEERELRVNTSTHIFNDVSSGDALRSKQDPRERSLRELALSDAIRTKFIVSCRTHEFFGSPKWQEIHVLSMDDNQISEFILTYMGEKGQELQNILKGSPSLMELARNPFFLKSMIKVYSPEISVIESRGQFLDYLCDQLLLREKSKGIIFNQKKVMAFIGKFAFKLIKKGLVGVPVKLDNKLKKHRDLINVLIGTGLMIPRGENQITFYHQIVQEFFAAHALREKIVKYPLSKMLAHKKWSETVLIWHDISSDSRIYRKLISSLTTHNSPWVKPLTRSFPLLIYDLIVWYVLLYILTNITLDILFGGKFILPTISKNPSLLYLLIVPLAFHYLWLLSSYNQEVIANASYILCKIKNPISINHIIKAFKNVSLIGKRTEIAKSLSEFSDTALNSLISNLGSSNTNIKLGCIETLGLIGKSDATQPLIAILNKGEIKLIRATAKALGNIGDPDASRAIADVIKLIEKMNFPQLTYGQVMQTLNQVKEIDDTLLKDIIQDLKVATSKEQSFMTRIAALYAMEVFGHTNCIDIILDIINDQNENSAIRERAVRSLSGIRDPRAATELVNIITGSRSLRRIAYETLGNIKNHAILPELHSLINHEHWMVRAAVIRSLFVIGNPESYNLLIGKVTDHDEDVREEVALGLSSLSTNESKAALDILIHDDYKAVRIKALESLDYAFPNTARDTFINLLNNKEYPEKVKILELLGNYRYPEVREVLLKMCIDSDDEISSQAATSLRKLDTSLERELTYIQKKSKTKPSLRLITYMYEKYMPGYSDLYRQAILSGVPAAERGVWIMTKVQEDSELKRKYRSFFIIVTIMTVFLCVISPPILGAIVPRGFITLGKYLWDLKWFSLGIMLLALFSILPKIRDGYAVSILKYLYQFIRIAGLSIAIIALSALGFYYWWICVPTIVIIGLGLYFLGRYRLRSAKST